jgi:hypothetical protein
MMFDWTLSPPVQKLTMTAARPQARPPGKTRSDWAQEQCQPRDWIAACARKHANVGRADPLSGPNGDQRENPFYRSTINPMLSS